MQRRRGEASEVWTFRWSNAKDDLVDEMPMVKKAETLTEMTRLESDCYCDATCCTLSPSFRRDYIVVTSRLRIE